MVILKLTMKAGDSNASAWPWMTSLCEQILKMGNQQTRGRLGRDNRLKLLFLWWIIETPVPPASQASFTSVFICSFPTFLLWLTSQSQSMGTIPNGNGCLCFVSFYSGLVWLPPVCLSLPFFILLCVQTGAGSWDNWRIFHSTEFTWWHIGWVPTCDCTLAPTWAPW